QLRLEELAQVADAYEVPKYDTAAVVQPVKGSNKRPKREVVLVENFEHCKDWSTLLEEVKSHLTEQAKLQGKDPPQMGECTDFIFRQVQESCGQELDHLKLPHFKDEN